MGKANENMLVLQRTLQLEAEGYFQGILNYYQKGAPSVAELNPDGIKITSGQPEITAQLESGKNGVGIDRSSVTVTLDGEPVRSFLLTENYMLSCRPQTLLKNGAHYVCITFRNMAGNSSAEKCASFSVASPPCNIEVAPIFPVIPPDGMATTPIDVRVLDCYGHPVIDGTEVKFAASHGSLMEPTVLTANGNARAILISEETPERTKIDVKAGQIQSSTMVLFASPDEALFMATLRDNLGNPAEGVEVVRNGHTIALSDTNL